MARTGSPTVEETEDIKTAEKEASVLGKEIRDLYFTKQTLAFYNDLKKTNKWTEDLANKVENKAATVRDNLMATEIGKKADESLASAAVATKKIAECFVCNQDKDDSCRHSALSLAVMKLFQLSFRFFLPLLLLRWSVDIGLFLTELAQALAKDFVRSGPTTARMPVPEFTPPDDDTTVEKKTHRVDSEETARKTPDIVNNFLFATWWDVVAYFLTLVFYVSKFFAIFFLIPYLSYQWSFLNALSGILHRLAGMNCEDTDPNNKEPGPGVGNGNRRLRERKISGRKWMADLVLNRLVNQLMDTPFVGIFMEILGIKRQLNFFQKLQKTFKGNFNLLNIQEGGAPRGLMMVVSDIGRYIEGDLAPYLHLDQNYNEEDDPDYTPSDSSEDSETTTDDDMDAYYNNRSGTEHAQQSAADGMCRPPRVRRNTESYDEQE